MKLTFLPLGAALGATALLLVGCSSPQATPAAAETSTATTSTATPTQCGSCDGKPQADHTGPSEPGWDSQSKTDALDVATKAMALYNRPKVDAKTWIRDLAQYMTNDAGERYQGVDPSNLPAFTVKEPGKLVVDPSNGFGAHVEFSTSVGLFDFQLLRQSADRPWKLQNVTLPPGLH